MYFFILEDSGGLICWVHSCCQFISHLHLCNVCHFSILSNRSVLCMVFILFCNGYFSIYRWNPNNFLVNLQYFSQIYSIYCEIREILIICHFWYPLSGLCTSQFDADFRSQREGSLCFVFVFLETIGIICFIHLHCTFNW